MISVRSSPRRTRLESFYVLTIIWTLYSKVLIYIHACEPRQLHRRYEHHTFILSAAYSLRARVTSPRSGRLISDRGPLSKATTVCPIASLPLKMVHQPQHSVPPPTAFHTCLPRHKSYPCFSMDICCYWSSRKQENSATATRTPPAIPTKTSNPVHTVLGKLQNASIYKL